MTTPTKISCYIRTLNEERMIGDVIDAASMVADEVIIIDSNSTDKTREIAMAKGARVVEQKWLGNGHQKRVGEELCANDWLLDLDADEIVSEQLAREIKLLFDNGKPACQVYEIPLVTVPPVGKPWYDIYVRPHTKLYDKRAIRIPAHASWDHFKIGRDISVGKLKGHILHHSFTDLGHLVQKYNTWSSFRAKSAHAKNRSLLIIRLLFGFPLYFIKHYFIRGLWKAGLYGFVISVIGAFSKWLGDAKMLEKSMK